MEAKESAGNMAPRALGNEFEPERAVDFSIQVAILHLKHPISDPEKGPCEGFQHLPNQLNLLGPGVAIVRCQIRGT